MNILFSGEVEWLWVRHNGLFTGSKLDIRQSYVPQWVGVSCVKVNIFGIHHDNVTSLTEYKVLNTA